MECNSSSKTIHGATSTLLSITTLNVNGQTILIKRHRAAARMKKQDPYIHMVPTETHFRSEDTD